MPRVSYLLRPFLPRAPLTRADKTLILLLWSAGVALGWSQGQASTLLPFIRADLGLTEGGMSGLLAFARLATFGAVLVGAAADRIGRRRPLVASLALMLVGTGLSATMTDPFGYGIAQAVTRVGGAAVGALAVVAMAEGVTRPVRAYAISFFSAAISLGGGLSIIALTLADATPLGWRLPHGLPVVLILIVPFLWRRLPESPVLEEVHIPLPWTDLLRGERGRRFALASAAGLLSSAFSSVGLAFTTTRLLEELQFSSGLVVLITLGGGTLGALGFFVGGRMADGWGRRPTSIFALLLALSGGITLFVVTSPWAAGLAAAASGFGTFAFAPAAGAHRAELFPTSLRAAANTASNYLGTVGSALGLLAGIVTIDRLGLTNTMIMLGVGVAMAAALTALLPETLGADLSDE